MSYQRDHLILDDFISVLILLNHFEHNDVKIGLYIENNQLLKKFTHSQLLETSKNTNTFLNNFHNN